MEYKEKVDFYNSISIEEFGERCKSHLKVEDNTFKDIANVNTAMTGAVLFALLEHYSAMKLEFRYTNFMLRLYIEAVKKGITPTWHNDTYEEYIEEYLAKSWCRSVETGLENGLGSLIELNIEAYKKYEFFHMYDENSSFSKNMEKARNLFANYGDDEKPVFYYNGSLFGFSEGFVGTNKRIYFTDDSNYSVRYEDIVDFYIQYCDTYTGEKIDFFRFDDLVALFKQNPNCLSAENINFYLKILYHDEKTGELCDRRLRGKARISTSDHNNILFALLFGNVVKDYTVIKNYEHFIEAKKTVDPDFAESYNKDSQAEIKKIYCGMSVKNIGLKCRELMASENEVINSIGKSVSGDIDSRITEIINHYTFLELKHRLNSFMLDLLIETGRKEISSDLILQFRPKLTEYFQKIPASFADSIDEIIKDMGRAVGFEKMENKKSQIKKIEKAKSRFAPIAPDEKILFFRSESMLGFSKGFIITDKKIHFCVEKIFSVKYEDIVDFCIKSTANIDISTFRFTDLERYAKQNTDTFSYALIEWHVKIIYKDEKTGELCEETFSSYSINNVKEAKFMFALAEEIKNHVFAIRYLKHFN